jgi:6-phosphogluconolactonase (cycloisomerase 2 family)
MWRPIRILETAVAVFLTTFLIACGSSGSTPAAGDFSLSLSPQSLSLPIGGGADTTQVSVQAINGFSNTVTVSITGLPTGVITTPASPFMMTPGTNQTVSFEAEPGMKPAVATVTFTGTSGTLAHSGTLSLSVATPVYAYVEANPAQSPGGQISEYAVDENTGLLTTVAGSPVSLPSGCCTSGPIDMVGVTETGGAFIYALGEVVSGEFSDTVYTFLVNGSNGVLTATAVPTTTFQPTTVPGTLAVYPNGKLLYVVQSGCTFAFLIDPGTGNLTQASCSSVPAADQSSFVIAPSGNFAFAAVIKDNPPGTLYTFSINPATGLLTQVQSITTGNALSGKLFTDPQGRALYLLTQPPPSGGCGSLFIWSINQTSGVLTPLNTSFSTPNCAPVSMAFTPGGQFAYITSLANQTNLLGIYSGTIDATGNLTNIPGSPFAIGSAPTLGVVEPSLGNYLIEAIGTPEQVTSFAIDPTTGVLTQVPSSSQMLTGNTPVKMVVVGAP